METTTASPANNLSESAVRCLNRSDVPFARKGSGSGSKGGRVGRDTEMMPKRGQQLTALGGRVLVMKDRQLPAQLVVADVAAWRAWLDDHESTSDGVRLVLAKKGTTVPTSLSYAEALEEALCSGWIDGRRNALDASTFQQLFTPRRARSIWSQRNVGIVGVLIASGRMRARGQVEVDRAKADGRWDRAYPGPAAAEVPADLASALECSPIATARFAELDRSSRYAIVHQVITASSDSIRARRISKFVTGLQI
jgi:uncharacterized protein YdeI (YjbR/CyaY-like superfamily)